MHEECQLMVRCRHGYVMVYVHRAWCMMEWLVDLEKYYGGAIVVYSIKYLWLSVG